MRRLKCQTIYNDCAHMQAVHIYLKGKRSHRISLSVTDYCRGYRIARCVSCISVSYYFLPSRLRRRVMHAARHRCNVHRVWKHSRWHDFLFRLRISTIKVFVHWHHEEYTYGEYVCIMLTKKRKNALMKIYINL